MVQKSAAPRGRPKGSRNRRTQAVLDAAEAGGISPLEFLLQVMRDGRRKFDVRFEAAKAAAPFVHPKLSSVQARVEDDRLPPVSAIELVVVRPGDLVDDDEPADHRLN